MAAGQNKVILEVLVKAKAETAAMGKAKGAMKGLGNATKKAGKDMHRFRVITADTQRRIGAFRNVLLLIKFAMATMGIRMFVRQLGTWVKAWAEQEKAVNRLNVALAGVGRYTKQVSKDYQKMAADMQKASVFGDEAIMEVMQTLMTLGDVADKDMRRATQAVLDFSTATGRDLAMATLLVAKAAVGYTGELSRYGIMIDKSLSKTEKFAATLEFLAKMKGRAEAETYTLAGAVQQLGNTYGDAKEQIGKALTEATNLVPALKLLNAWIVIVANNTITTGQIMLDLGNVFIWVLRATNKAILFFKTLGNILQIGINIIGAFAAAIAGMGAIFLRGIMMPLKQVMKGLSGFFAWMAEKTTWLADLIANIPFDFPGKDIMIEGLDAVGTAFKGIGADTGALAKIFKTIDEDAKRTLNDVYATINALPAAVAKNLKDMVDAGASYNKFNAEIDRLIILYPKLIKQFEEARKLIVENREIQDIAKNAKAWEDALKAAGKYYTLTTAEERKARDIAIEKWALTAKGIAEASGDLDKFNEILARMKGEAALKFPITFGEGVESGLDKLVTSYGSAYDRIANMTQDLAKTMQSTMSEVFFDAFTGELKTTAEYYQAFAKTMLKTTMDYVTKEIMAMAIGKRAEEGLERESVIKKMAIKAWEFAGRQKLRVLNLAAESAAAIKSVAISAWEAIRKVAMAVWQFVAKTWSAYASIPYVGVASAIAVTAAGVAAIAAYRPMAKGGIVTERTNATIGEAGPEAVIPLKRGAGGKLGIAAYGGGDGGGTVIENHYYINAVDPRSFADIVESNPAIISEVINRNIKRNGTNRDVMRAYA